MLALILCGFVVTGQVATDPVVAVQLRYPVSRVTLTTTSGSNVFYTLPQNAPIELRRAVKVLEYAERDVILTETLNILRLEYVQNERRLEAARTAASLNYMQNPIGGGNSGCGPTFYAMPPQPPESTLKKYISLTLVREASTERALAALDRLADAQYKLHLTWVALAYPDRKPPGVAGAQPPAPPADAAIQPAAVPADPGKVLAVVPAVAPPAPVKVPGRSPSFQEVTEALNANAETLKAARRQADELANEVNEARKRDFTANVKEIEARLRYQRATIADEKAEAKREWEAATKAHDEARAEWEAVGQKWKAACERVRELTSPRPNQPTATPQQSPIRIVNPVAEKPEPSPKPAPVSPGEDKPVPPDTP